MSIFGPRNVWRRLAQHSVIRRNLDGTTEHRRNAARSF
jgi:hypothetical protein